MSISTARALSSYVRVHGELPLEGALHRRLVDLRQRFAASSLSLDVVGYLDANVPRLAGRLRDRGEVDQVERYLEALPR